MSGPPREGCPIHAPAHAIEQARSVTEPLTRIIEVVGDVEWGTARVCMDHVFTSPVFRMERIARGYGCTFTNTGNVYRFDFTR